MVRRDAFDLRARMQDSLSWAPSRHARSDPGALHHAAADGIDRTRLRLFRIDRMLSRSLIHTTAGRMRGTLVRHPETRIGMNSVGGGGSVAQGVVGKGRRLR